MGAELLELSLEDFRRALTRVAAAPLETSSVEAMFAHYEELRRWNGRLSLVGPGTVETAVERHFGEALRVLPLIDSAQTLLDVGSGGGFPALVLAAALPGLRVTLVEARARKWSFLNAVKRRAELSVTCLNARVDRSFGGPERQFDLVTWRAVRVPKEVVEHLASFSSRMLVWCGEENPEVPTGWEPKRVVELEGSERRRILEMAPR